MEWGHDKYQPGISGYATDKIRLNPKGGESGLHLSSEGIIMQNLKNSRLGCRCRGK